MKTALMQTGMKWRAKGLETTVDWREKWQQPDWLTGSEILLRCLALEGVECVFGYPGGAVLYLYDALCGFQGFRHVLARHEQGAIHAADGYARASGKTGVCMATSGPGATNLITGIATAHMDSVPMVVVTGNVALSLMGTDAFQEADIVGMTLSITKHSYLVRDVRDIPQIVKEAFHIASTGRKGPVLIDLPKDISGEKTLFQMCERFEPRSYRYRLEPPDSANIQLVLDEISKVRRPVILAGAGVIHAGASDDLREFAERTRIPVTTTLLGIGGFPSGHELSLGMPGMHGTYAANMAIQNSDLLIGVGARFDDRVTMKVDGFAPRAKIIHIDIDAAEMSRTIRSDITCLGDAKQILRQLNEWAADTGAVDSADWLEQIFDWQHRQPLRYKDSTDKLKPQFVIEMISNTTGGEAIVTTDVGQHQMWTAQYYKFKHPRSMITSGGLGTMGFGLPAAIGAQTAYPDKLIISINGDGGIQMCSQEMAVCAINRIPIKIVILNNQVLGMVRQWQEINYEKRYSHVDLAGSPDFVKLAEAYGIKGLRASCKLEAATVWQEALETDGPVLIEFVVDKDENVYPMVPSGATIGEMLLGET